MSWFEISNDGWKRMNAGRPCYELVKELIQNILDEDFNVASIDFSFNDGKFSIIAEDDVSGGIKNHSVITTVFLTGKQDSHLTRGRKGRGLKELLSVCESASVETSGMTIQFNSDGTRSEFSNTRENGTKITCTIANSEWNDDAVSSIESYLRKIIIPHDKKMYVNKKLINYRSPSLTLEACLLTQLIEDGIQKDRYKITRVEVYNKQSDKGWIYEMGIPVQETDIPHDVNVCQRIPMNDNRNQINSYYEDSLKDVLWIGMVDTLSKKDLCGWAASGVHFYSMCDDIKDKFVKILTGNNIDGCVLKSDKRIFNDKAKQKGMGVFDASGIHSNLSDVLSKLIKNSEEFVVNADANSNPVYCAPTDSEKILLDAHKKLVYDVLKINIDFDVVEKQKDTLGNKTLGFHLPNKISYNRLAVSKSFWKNPYGRESLNLLFHELGHEVSPEHDLLFIDTVTEFAGKIAAHLAKNKPDVVIDKSKEIVYDGKTFRSKSQIVKYLYEIDNNINKSKTAEDLGITVQTVHAIIKKIHETHTSK